MNNIISFLEMASKKEYKSWIIIQLLLEKYCRIQEDLVKNDIRTIKLIDIQGNIIILKSTRVFENIQEINTIEYIEIIYKYIKYKFNGIYN